MVSDSAHTSSYNWRNKKHIFDSKGEFKYVGPMKSVMIDWTSEEKKIREPSLCLCGRNTWSRRAVSGTGRGWRVWFSVCDWAVWTAWSMAAAPGSFGPAVPPSRPLAVWVGTPSNRTSNPNTGAPFTGHYPCDWQDGPPLRGLHMSLSLSVMFRRLIGVTIKAFHEVLAVKRVNYYLLLTWLFSFYCTVIKVEPDPYWHLLEGFNWIYWSSVWLCVFGI